MSHVQPTDECKSTCVRGVVISLAGSLSTDAVRGGPRNGMKAFDGKWIKFGDGSATGQRRGGGVFVFPVCPSRLL